MEKGIRDQSIKLNQKLLDVSICKKYDFKLCKKRLTAIMDNYKEYLCEELNLYPPTITSSYQVRYSQQPKNNSTDKVGNYVAKKLDLEVKANELFEDISNMIDTRLTPDERIYFVESFINGTPEIQICEQLQIYRNSLTRIKESAIIKASLYFLIAEKTTDKK